MKKSVALIIIVISIILVVACNVGDFGADFKNVFNNNFYLLSSPDNKDVESELVSYAKDNDIDLIIEYADDLEAVDLLKENTSKYDAVWMSNSVWLYMIDDVKISESKSININPVVFGIKKSKAEKLGFVNNKINNIDIVNAIKNGELSYVMTSVTKTNTGLIAYLGFLNSLSGSPEILTMDMLNDNNVKKDLTTLFSGVQRVSGSDSFLEDMFLNSNDYEAVVATESSLIRINKKLVNMGLEPLYLLYPTDGVAINDSPFAYVDHSQDKLEEFKLLQSFLLSDNEQLVLEEKGKRTWYGGIKPNANKSSFKLEWGINTNEYLMPLKYPSRDVMTEAIALYIDEFRKPSAIAFCLDYSGSMDGEGEMQLESAMSYILNREEAKNDLIQFSEKDEIIIIPFSDSNMAIYKSKNGIDTLELIDKVLDLYPNGGTNIYDCSIEALEQLDNYSDDYTKTIVLMTDGESNYGSFSELSSRYHNHNIPIYSIMFGNASPRQLNNIALLTNAKVFDGRKNLISAFKEVRSYN